MTESGVQLVAGNLRRLRDAAGLSLAALAERSGVAKGTISELERGRGNPTIETLFALAYALDATLADFVGDPGTPDAQVVRAVDRPFIQGRPSTRACCTAASSTGSCSRSTSSSFTPTSHSTPERTDPA